MKKPVVIVFSLLITFLSAGCSKDEPKEVSGTIEFNEAGLHYFKIDASDIKATIIIIGAGGGGGGGVGYTAGGVNSTGGGGGGGAGEVKLLMNIALQQNVNYAVNIGEGGAGGNVNISGANGQASDISLEQIKLYTALPGSGGRSNSSNNIAGGSGGNGFSGGSPGSSGQILDVNWSGLAGTGGAGGNNSSTFGLGGNGGKGTEVKNLTPVNAFPGNRGGSGYVKIEWTGIK
jgi:hypothetical protein